MARPIATLATFMNAAIGPPLKYIDIYMAGPIATFMNVAIDLTYSRVF